MGPEVDAFGILLDAPLQMSGDGFHTHINALSVLNEVGRRIGG